MPNKLSDSKKRVSIAEQIEIVEQLQKLAQKEGKTLTDIYAEASRLLIAKRKLKHKK